MSEDRYDIQVTSLGKGSVVVIIKEPGINQLAIQRLKPITPTLRARLNGAITEKGANPLRYAKQTQWPVLSPLTPTNAKSTGVSGLAKLMLSYYHTGTGIPNYQTEDASLVLLKEGEVIPRYLSKQVLDTNRALIEPLLEELVAKLH